MHSYIKDNNGDGWLVIFYLPHTQEGPPRHAINVVKEFPLEYDAAAYASYLNGGLPPGVFRVMP